MQKTEKYPERNIPFRNMGYREQCKFTIHLIQTVRQASTHWIHFKQKMSINNEMTTEKSDMLGLG